MPCGPGSRFSERRREFDQAPPSPSSENRSPDPIEAHRSAPRPGALLHKQLSRRGPFSGAAPRDSQPGPPSLVTASRCGRSALAPSPPLSFRPPTLRPGKGVNSCDTTIGGKTVYGHRCHASRPFETNGRDGGLRPPSDDELPPDGPLDGKLIPLPYPPLTVAETKQLAYSVLTDDQKHRFEENLELDFSFGVKGLARFRANNFMQRGAVAGVYRQIPTRSSGSRSSACRRSSSCSARSRAG
jgi:hypothetical protein